MGAFAFETAAVALIKDLDVSSFEENDYFLTGLYYHAKGIEVPMKVVKSKLKQKKIKIGEE